MNNKNNTKKKVITIILAIIVLAVAILLLLKGCSPKEELVVHNHSYKINEEGTWICKEDNDILSNTDKPYVAILENNEPKDILAIDSLSKSKINLGNGTIYKDGNNIYYSGNNAQTIIIKTQKVDDKQKDKDNLVINAPNDTVYHYGSSTVISLDAVATNSFHEYGKVELITLTKARVVLENKSDVKEIYLDINDSNYSYETTIIALKENVELPRLTRDAVNLEEGEVKTLAIVQKLKDEVKTETNTETNEVIETVLEVQAGNDDYVKIENVRKSNDELIIEAFLSPNADENDKTLTDNQSTSTVTLEEAKEGSSHPASHNTFVPKQEKVTEVVKPTETAKEEQKQEETKPVVTPTEEDTPSKPSHTHSYGNWYELDATYHAKKCSCGDIVKNAHSYTWNTTTDATCVEDGVKDGICTCGHTKTEIVPKLGHNFVNGTCTRCGAKKFEIHNEEELRTFASDSTNNYGIIANDFVVNGTVPCTRTSDFTIDFNGNTINFKSEDVSSSTNPNKGAFSIETGKTIKLVDTSSEKTGKFVNTATTTGSGNVYLVGINSSTNSSVVIDGLNIEMNSTSSTSGQIYGVVRSYTYGKYSNNITVKNSKITLKASTGSTAGAFIYGDYCNTITVDNCEINSTGSGKMIRTGSSSVANISNSKFDVETDPNSLNSITALEINGASTVIDNVEINAEGYIPKAISVKSNATVKNSKISVIAGTKGDPQGILVQGTEGAIIDNCEVYVSSLTDSASYTAKGIVLSSADNVVIKNCNITAKNLGETTNLPKSIYFNSTTPKNKVEDSYCTGEVYGVNVISGHYSHDPINWVSNDHTTSKENDWYIIKNATAEDYVCSLTYTENSQTVTEKFVTLSAAIRRTSDLKAKEDLTLTIKKDCELSLSLSIYSNVVINEGVNVNLSAGSLANTGTITNNGVLSGNSLTIPKNWTFNNNGTVSLNTLTVNSGTADKDGNKTADPATLNNNGTITVSSKLTMSALSGYALNNTNDETKEQLKAKLVNNGSLLGVDSTSTLAANCPITGTNPYQSETYKWNDGSWTIGGAVKNITKDKNYDSLSTAISEADSNDELKLFADFQPSRYKITKNLTIDLNGHVLDFWNYSNVSGQAKAFTIDGATLTIDDKSENHNGKVIATAGAAIWIKDNSSLVLNNGTIENTGRGGTYSCVILIAGYESGHEVGATSASLVVNGGKIIASSEEWTDPTTDIYYFPGDGIYVYGHGDETNAPSITLTAGEISSNGTAISGQGSYDYANISISGGTVTSYGGCAMYLPQKGITNIAGGTITGKTGICIKGGTLNISGGAINGVGDKYVPSEALGSGTNLTGDAIYIEDNYTQRAINVSITGGTLYSTNGYQVQKLFSIQDESYDTIINIENETIANTNGISPQDN